MQVIGRSSLQAVESDVANSSGQVRRRPLNDGGATSAKHREDLGAREVQGLGGELHHLVINSGVGLLSAERIFDGGGD